MLARLMMIVSLATVVSSPASANAIKKVIDCGNGALVMDQISGYPNPSYQVVVRDAQLVTNLLKKTPIRGNQKGEAQELIFSGLSKDKEALASDDLTYYTLRKERLEYILHTVPTADGRLERVEVSLKEGPAYQIATVLSFSSCESYSGL